MARQSNAEQELKRIKKLASERQKRYAAAHDLAQFKVALTRERFDEIDLALKKANITKKQFLESAIDNFLKGEK